VLAAVFVAEVGDVTRFADLRRLCSWAGLTPRHRESDSKVRRGGTTKQGSTVVRWAAIEAATGAHREPRLAAVKRVAARRGINIGKSRLDTFSRSSTTECATARYAHSPTNDRVTLWVGPICDSANGVTSAVGEYERPAAIVEGYPLQSPAFLGDRDHGTSDGVRHGPFRGWRSASRPARRAT
jgi:Transposase IS116/IS110/IS902 family